MRKVTVFACLILLSFPAMAEILTCEGLRARVDAKLQAKGVQIYTLEIVPIADLNNTTAASGVPASKINHGKEVGTCEHGTKRLMYTRGN